MLFEIIIVQLLVHPLVISGENVPNAGTERALVAEYLIKKVLNEINPNENVVIAPNEMQNLLKELRAAYNENSTALIAASNDNDANATDAPDVLQPMQVRNALQIVELQNQQMAASNGHRHNVTIVAVEKLQNLEELCKLFATKHAGAASMQLINEVTLNARWAFNFQKRDTHKRLFYPTQQDQHTYLDAMRKDDIFHYGQLQDLNATALMLSLYPQDYKLILLLPHAMNGLLPLAAHLHENLHIIADESALRKQLRARLVRVALPKLRITHTMKLKEVLQEFDVASGCAQLADVAQHVHLDINERGIGKLERTTVLFWNAFSSFRTSPAIFELNHPFLFLIRNSQGIQFFGYINKLN